MIIQVEKAVDGMCAEYSQACGGEIRAGEIVAHDTETGYEMHMTCLLKE